MERWRGSAFVRSGARWCGRLVSVAIVASVIVMPFRLGFFIEADTVWWRVYDGVIDLVFWIDILFNFRTTYLDDNMTHVTVTEMIIARYLKGWFLIDLVSTMPFHLFGSKSQRKRNMLWKLFRAFRLFKLVKVFNHEFKFLRSDYFEMHTSLVRCFKLMLTLLFLAHLFGCFWSYTAGEAMEMDPNDESTLSWWTNDHMNSAIFQQEDDWTGYSNLAQRYIASIYWAFTTMTTVGYGDIVPSNDTERVYATVIMVLGATVFGYVVGSVSAIANNQNSAIAKEAEVMQRVIFHMTELSLSTNLRESVKMTVNYILTRKSAFNEQSILENMPADLRRDCILSSHHDIIPHVAIFEGQSPTLIAHMITLMRPIFHAAGDIIYRPQDGADGIYFLLNGIAEQTSLHEVKLDNDPDGETVKELEVNKVLNVGSFFGHEGFLVPDGEQANLMIGARAFTSCSLYVLLERDIANVSIRHRYFGAQLRSALKDAILRLHAQKALMANVRSNTGLASSLLVAARAQQEASKDDKAKKAIVNSIDDLPRRIMARRRSTKIELAKLHRRDHARASHSGDAAGESNSGRSDVRSHPKAEVKESGDKEQEMEIMHSNSHSSLQSHEDTKVFTRTRVRVCASVCACVRKEWSSETGAPPTSTLSPPSPPSPPPPPPPPPPPRKPLNHRGYHRHHHHNHRHRQFIVQEPESDYHTSGYGFGFDERLEDDATPAAAPDQQIGEGLSAIHRSNLSGGGASNRLNRLAKSVSQDASEPTRPSGDLSPVRPPSGGGAKPNEER